MMTFPASPTTLFPPNRTSPKHSTLKHVAPKQMRLSRFLLRTFLFLLPPALLATVYLYAYPLLKQCGFPAASAGRNAPFRLLALADPQLEGDTSLPTRHESVFPSLERFWSHIEQGRDWTTLKEDGRRLIVDDLPRAFQTYRKLLDLWGNDLYLAHIYRTINWFTDPTHVVVLGDLLGSQWIGDNEFESRTNRFWARVFRGGEKVPMHIMDANTVHKEVLGRDESWKRRIIAVAGNHDVGYAADLDEHRVRRFEHGFGRVNWEVQFSLDDGGLGQALNASFQPPALRLVILNSMNLDEPARDQGLRQESLDFLDRKFYNELPSSDTATVLLTHIPLYKDENICVDGPFFDYFPDYYGGGIKEQNHLSHGVSDRIIHGVLGPERNREAIVLNGHDHEGCHTYHTRANDPNAEPVANSTVKYSEAMAAINNPESASLQEITVRSMMGSFDGNAGLLSAWWDSNKQKWAFEYSSCMCGVQHIWWAVHVFDIIVLAIGWLALTEAIMEDVLKPSPVISKEKKTS